MKTIPRILIVEDETIVAMDIKSNLLKLGYEICGVCVSGEQAVQQALELQPSLILMDIRLKGEIDGIEAAERINDSRRTPIVYLTAHADDSTVERAKITDPFGYVLKPFQSIELRVAIELALHKFSLENSDMGESLRTKQPIEFEGSQRNPLSAEQLQTILESIHQSAPTAAISDKNLSALISLSTKKRYSAGDHIVFEGDERNSGFLVLTGRLSLLKTSLTGRELIVEALLPGDLFGIALALEEQPYTFSARAQIDTELLLVPRRALVSLLENESALYRAFVDLIAKRLNRAHSLSRALAHDKVEVRIAAGLLAMLPSSIRHDNQSRSIRVTRKELSEMSGTTVETAIRVTKAMERGGLLDLTKNGIVTILDTESLDELAEGF